MVEPNRVTDDVGRKSVTLISIHPKPAARGKKNPASGAGFAGTQISYRALFEQGWPLSRVSTSARRILSWRRRYLRRDHIAHTAKIRFSSSKLLGVSLPLQQFTVEPFGFVCTSLCKWGSFDSLRTRPAFSRLNLQCLIGLFAETPA